MIAVAGGQWRGVGKTAVAAALIQALPGFSWTALKITHCEHVLGGGAHELETPGGASYRLAEQHQPDATDTGRLLGAGARRAYWLRPRPGALALAMPAINRLIGEAPNVLIESNSVLEFLKPDLYLLVVSPAQHEWKPSARRFLPMADAVVITGNGEWPGAPAGKARFQAAPPGYASGELAAFVRQRLIGAQ